MSNIRLFRASSGTVTELAGEGFALERNVQNLVIDYWLSVNANIIENRPEAVQ